MPKRRARDLGLPFGGETGSLNADLQTRSLEALLVELEQSAADYLLLRARLRGTALGDDEREQLEADLHAKVVLLASSAEQAEEALADTQADTQ
ncbi:hypothetical protein [Calidithermus chliarophilus]|uniref:hypothetical protein n=1 Tax=Calidithermus chliarophilus TaxID=52023 RepID=UPI0003F6B0D3|nr:hypothetical protein [Calidithermus chliarophilus]